VLRQVQYWLSRRPPNAAQTQFVADARGNDVLENKKADLPRPDLCVVITTHRRAESLRRLLGDLQASLLNAGQPNTFVLVLNDASDFDYGPVIEFLRQHLPGRFAFYESTTWLGKRGFWRVYQQAFDVVRCLRPAHVLFLQDDLSFGGGLVADVLNAWACQTFSTSSAFETTRSRLRIR
jgi:hypothetical protein